MKGLKIMRAAVPAGAVVAAFSLAMAGGRTERTFEFRYEATLQDLPANAGRVAIWIPYPQGDAHQEVHDVKVDAPFRAEVRKDPAYGNRILYLSADKPAPGPVHVGMTIQVRRSERVNRPDLASGVQDKTDTADLERWLRPDRRVPLDDRIRKLAEEVTLGRATDREKARAIYDYVVGTMKYDKTGTGWGNGDIYWACDARRGNCTDFHALFIGLSRAVGIPAKFAIGFPLPPERGQGEIPGYHCWAEFHLKDRGWVPVDASEAYKHPDKRDYFFGAHDENRVQLTIGRDLVLDPPQAGDPLNYFIYPYVEVDGKAWEVQQKRFSYRDLEAVAGTALERAGS